MSRASCVVADLELVKLVNEPGRYFLPGSFHYNKNDYKIRKAIILIAFLY